MLLLLGLLGCSTPVAKAPDADTTDTTDTGDAETGQTDTGDAETGQTDTSQTDTSPPCTPVSAVFFDLGETLVTERSDGLFEELPGATALVQALRDQGTPVGLISNTGRDWDMDDLRDLLVDPSILDLFDVILLSSLAESRPKPDPAIFVEAVGLLDPAPEISTTVFVTEEEEDLTDGEPPTEGAQAAGMIGVLVTGRATSAPVDHTLDPDDLPSLVDEPWMACLEDG